MMLLTCSWQRLGWLQVSASVFIHSGLLDWYIDTTSFVQYSFFKVKNKMHKHSGWVAALYHIQGVVFWLNSAGF